MSSLFRDVFDDLGLPFHDDSVGESQTVLMNSKHQTAPLRLGTGDTQSQGLTQDQGRSLGRDLPTVFRQTDASIFIGDFTLADNPASIVAVTNKRIAVLDRLLAELETQRQNEPDDFILNKIHCAIRKAQRKRHKTFEEFEEPFKQAFAHDITLQISQYDKQEKLEERAYNQQTKHQYGTVAPYQARYTDAIDAQRQILRQREDFIHTYSRTPAGYQAYLKDTLAQDAYAFFLKRLRARLPLHERKAGAYLLAKTRSGKSELMKTLIYNEIQRMDEPSCSIMLIDPHGDVAQEIAQFKEFATPQGRERLVYIDPLLTDGATPSINPFELQAVTDRNVSVMTQELIKILAVLLAGAGTTMQMEAILSPCIGVLLRKQEASFRDLQRFMDDNRNKDLVELGKQSPNQAHRDLFNNKFHDDQYRATKHGIYTRIQILLNDPIFQNLISDKTTLDLAKLTDEKKIILFRLPLGEVGSDSVQAFGRFVVGMMRITALQRSTTLPHLRTDTHLYIDEVQNFISDDIEVALTQLRKYGLYLTLANQYVGQRMDTQLQQALFSTGIMIAGQNETKSLKAVEQRIKVPLHQLEDLKVGEFYVKTSNHPAFKIKGPTYLLGGRHAMKPDQWQTLIQHNLARYYRPVEQLTAEQARQQENQALHEEMQQAKDIQQVVAKSKGAFKPKYDI